MTRMMRRTVGMIVKGSLYLEVSAKLLPTMMTMRMKTRMRRMRGLRQSVLGKLENERLYVLQKGSELYLHLYPSMGVQVDRALGFR
jgi:hypothetical protein